MLNSGALNLLPINQRRAKREEEAVLPKGGAASKSTWAMTPKTRADWEAERLANRAAEAKPAAAYMPPPARPAEIKIDLSGLIGRPVAPMPRPVLVAQAPIEEIGITDEEMAAAAAVLLSVRAHAYRMAQSGFKNGPLAA